MAKQTTVFIFTLVVGIFVLCLNGCSKLVEHKNQLVRIAKLEIDSTQLDFYKAALKEEAETSIQIEPGVLTLNAVFDKKNPTKVTVFEIYADTAAYQSHIKTPHFLKYKTSTKDMVKALELVDVVPIALGSKTK